MPQSDARPTKHCRLESEIVQNPLARPAVCRIASRPRRSRAIKAELGIRLAVVVHPGCTNYPVQPGCTNLGLSTSAPVKGQCQRLWPRWLQPGPDKGRIEIEHAGRLCTQPY